MATNLTNSVISSIKIQGITYTLKSVPFHATDAEWLVSGYVPKEGELIVYDADASTNYPRYKTGDGVTEASLLPFSIVTQKEFELFQKQLSSAGHLKREIVGSLPEVGELDVIYMVKASLTANNNYEEWMYIDGEWELIGDTKVDLSDYVTTEALEERLALVPGYYGTVKEVSAGTGLKVKNNSKVDPMIDFDDECVFIFYGGTATELID